MDRFQEPTGQEEYYHCMFCARRYHYEDVPEEHKCDLQLCCGCAAWLHTHTELTQQVRAMFKNSPSSATHPAKEPER